MSIMNYDKLGMQIAIEEAKKGLSEGGIPIGACFIDGDGKIWGRGHNLRVQNKSPILHGETCALQNAGRLPASVYKKCTLYTTLSPCSMCSGAALLYGFKRIVLGENETFVGAEEWLKKEGVEVVNAESEECKKMMHEFIEENPKLWNEDIGEEEG